MRNDYFKYPVDGKIFKNTLTKAALKYQQQLRVFT
jgi:hypothetical protein